MSRVMRPSSISLGSYVDRNLSVSFNPKITVQARYFAKWAKSTTALAVVDNKKNPNMQLNKGPRRAFTKSKPMPIRTRRMVQISRLVNGLPVPDALQQLRFCNKKQYPLDKVIHNASNLMSIRYGLQPNELMVESICVGTSFIKKGLDIKGRGHMGRKRRSYSNVYVIVKEGKPKLSEYGERRRAAKLEKQARIKREFQEKRDKAIEFI